MQVVSVKRKEVGCGVEAAVEGVEVKEEGVGGWWGWGVV